MKNKLFTLIILVLLCLAIVGCTNELYYDIGQNIEGEKGQNIVKIPDYQYVYSETKNAMTSPEYIWFSNTSRGIIFMPNNGIISVYNPETGTVNSLCPDPLCSHQPYSGCPYGNCVFTRSLPIEYEDSLYYFVKDEYYKNEILYKNYIIYSTDIAGHSIEMFYKNDGNYITSLTVEEEAIYFLEVIDENHAIISRIELENKNVSRITYDENETLFIISYICMNDRIYYMTDDGIIYSCSMNFENIRVEYDTKYAPKMMGRASENKLYWCIQNVLYQYDPITQQCSELIKVDEKMRIANLFNEESGIYYQVFPENVTVSLEYSEYTEKMSDYNILYYLNVEDDNTITEYILPEDFYISVNGSTVCNGLLVTQTYIENQETKKLAGRPYYAYDLKTEQRYLITDVAGY